jgi:hypothetical protein
MKVVLSRHVAKQVKVIRINWLNAFPSKLVSPSHVEIAMGNLASAGKKHVRTFAHKEIKKHANPV